LKANSRKWKDGKRKMPFPGQSSGNNVRPRFS
jgi:hypothetical protein